MLPPIPRCEESRDCMTKEQNGGGGGVKCAMPFAWTKHGQGLIRTRWYRFDTRVWTDIVDIWMH